MSALLKGGNDHPGADDIQVMTRKVSRGLEFSAVELPGVGYMNAMAGAGRHRRCFMRRLLGLPSGWSWGDEGFGKNWLST